MSAELKVISNFYDFAIYLGQRIEKFPRHHRYSLGSAMEQGLRDILALLLRAKYRRDNAAFLEEVNIQLEILRFQIRMAKDLRALPMKSHGHASKLLQGIGAQVGGWLRSRKATA